MATGDNSAEDKTIIHEAGTFAFFVRGRVVGVDEPSVDLKNIDTIARSYILLRPIAQTKESIKGVIAKKNAARILILPKKMLPSQGDRFMSFVAKANMSEDEIKRELNTPSDYMTKTAVLHHSPAATQVCEGIYTLSSSIARGKTHLIYEVTEPATLGEFERNTLRVQERGSFIISTKNPDVTSPANVQLPEAPHFSKEIMNDFRSLRWLPTIPVHLDYDNAQLLLIGERSLCDEDGEAHNTNDELEVKVEEGEEEIE